MIFNVVFSNGVTHLAQMALVPRKPSMAVSYHRFCLRIRQSLLRNGAQNLQHLKILLLLFSTTITTSLLGHFENSM